MPATTCIRTSPCRVDDDLAAGNLVIPPGALQIVKSWRDFRPALHRDTRLLVGLDNRVDDDLHQRWRGIRRTALSLVHPRAGIRIKAEGRAPSSVISEWKTQQAIRGWTSHPCSQPQRLSIRSLTRPAGGAMWITALPDMTPTPPLR